MKGIAYGVGVGPGDPELLTLKAVRLIKETEIIAVPGKNPRETVAYKIAVQAVPELENKTLVPLHMPMSTDMEVLKKSHRECADTMAAYLEKGENVVFLTLGDASVYCTFTYLQPLLKQKGFETRLVSGITSFCAAAARLNVPLSEWGEEIHIIPASHRQNALPDYPGTCVLMKSASHMKETKELLKKSGKMVLAVENCSMPGEKIYNSLKEIPDDAGYFTLILAKDPEKQL